MKFNHAVKYNGIFYPTGADVPVEEEPKNEVEIIKESEIKHESVTEVENEPKKQDEVAKEVKTETNKVLQSTKEYKGTKKAIKK